MLSLWSILAGVLLCCAFVLYLMYRRSSRRPCQLPALVWATCLLALTLLIGPPEKLKEMTWGLYVLTALVALLGLSVLWAPAECHKDCEVASMTSKGRFTLVPSRVFEGTHT